MAEQTCTCTTTAQTMRHALEGQRVPRCPVHETFGAEPSTTQLDAPLALNSDTLADHILDALTRRTPTKEN